MVSSVRGRVQEMRDNVLSSLEKSQSETLNSAKQMANDVEHGIQKGVDESTAAFDVINNQVDGLAQTFNSYRSKLTTDKTTLQKVKELMERMQELIKGQDDLMRGQRKLEELEERLLKVIEMPPPDQHTE